MRRNPSSWYRCCRQDADRPNWGDRQASSAANWQDINPTPSAIGAIKIGPVCAGGPCLKGGKAAALKDGLHHASEELIGEIKVNLGLRWKHTRMGRI